MSGITFDLGNAPSVLEALRNPGNAQRVANAMAERYVDGCGMAKIVSAAVVSGTAQGGGRFSQ